MIRLLALAILCLSLSVLILVAVGFRMENRLQQLERPSIWVHNG